MAEMSELLMYMKNECSYSKDAQTQVEVLFILLNDPEKVQ